VLDRALRRLTLRLSFRGDRAFRAALRDDPAERVFDDLLFAERIAVDERERTLDYKLYFPREMKRDEWVLYAYTDRAFRPVELPELGGP